MAALWAAPAYAQKVKLELRGRSDVIVPGDKFQIQLKIDRSVRANPTNLPTTFKGAKMLYPWQEMGFSQSKVIVNGKVVENENNRIYTVTLRAEAEGEYTFGPVTVGGHKSNRLTYRISDEGSAHGNTRPGYGQMPSVPGNIPQNQGGGPTYIGTGDNQLFLVANVSKTTAYQQEALLYTVTLYSSYSNIHFLGATEAPKFDGFVLEDSRQAAANLHVTTYKGKRYLSAEIARYIIFPQMEGQLKIIGNKYTITAESRSYYSDPDFPMLSYGSPVQLSVKPNDLVVNVQRLPQPQPAGFSGGVGTFSIKASPVRTGLFTNQASGIVYTVTGSGNIKYVSAPDLESVFPPQLELTTPTSTVNAAASGGTVTGSVRFDYSVMPLETGVFTIPGVEFVYFNPQTRRYETATAPGYTLRVEQGKASGRSQTRQKARFEPGLMAVDAPLRRNHAPWVGTVGYWLWYVLPVVLLMVAVPVVRRYRKSRSDLAALNSRRANRIAARRLRLARKAMDKGLDEQFFTEILAGLWGYAADKLRMPGSELNRDNVKERLEAHGVAPATSGEFIRLIDEAEFARYAVGAVSPQQVYSAAATVIKEIENSFK